MKGLLYALLSLVLFQCGNEGTRPTVEDSEYSSKIARFSDDSANPYNWGATPKEMAAWAIKSNWKPVPEIRRDEGDDLDLKPITYWKDEQEEDFRQLITLLFKSKQLVGINLVATGRMDEAILHAFDQEYEKMRTNVWMSRSAQAAVKRDDRHEEQGVIYLIGDLRLSPPQLQ